MSEQIEALKNFYAAINRNDIQAIHQYFAPDVEQIEPPDFPTAGT